MGENPLEVSELSQLPFKIGLYNFILGFILIIWYQKSDFFFFSANFILRVFNLKLFIFSVGEELFGLPHTNQTKLEVIKKELNLLQRKTFDIRHIFVCYIRSIKQIY